MGNSELPYLALTDFDLSSVMKPGETEKMFDHSPSSEANYIAPELHKGQAYQ
jgi:serine/threonine protein kinase